MTERNRIDPRRVVETGPAFPTTAAGLHPDHLNQHSSVDITRGPGAPPTTGRRGPVVVGVDPGVGGGLACLTLDGTVVAVAPMPVRKRAGKIELDVPGLVAILRLIEARHAIGLVVVERVHTKPKQGVGSAFASGRSLGQVQGAVQTLGLTLKMPLATTWRRCVLAGTRGDKFAAITYAKSRFPSAPLLMPAQPTRPHLGITHGLCLAEWGRRLILGTGPGA